MSEAPPSGTSKMGMPARPPETSAREGGASSFLVAAIGTAEGRLDALSTLLRGLRAQVPMALLIVPAVEREQRGAFLELLADWTTLQLVEAEDGMPIEVGHAYLLSPGRNIVVADGQLTRSAATGAQLDELFRSLARCYRERAVGVVLTRESSKGAAGLREIKAVGGITIAERASGPEQPVKSLTGSAARAADIQLPLDEIALELARLAELPLFQGKPAPDSGESAGTEELYATIFRLLRRGTGVDFSHYKRPTIARRMARRMALRRVPSLAVYAELLQKDPSEVQSLHEDVLIHVTSFFREPDSFEVLKNSVFPELLADRDRDPIRVWVPGCSTGEEVYSLAIALCETLEADAGTVPIQLFGTDISRTAVETARAGFYDEASVAEVSPERLRRFFSKTDAGYQIGKGIRERCVFARQDITRDPPFSRLDLIVCRNTLIYLGQPIQRRVISLMHYALKRNGFLMLGRAETTGASAELFATFEKRAKIYRKKPSALVPDFDFQPAPFEATAAGTPGEPARLPVVVSPTQRRWDTQAEADRMLLELYAPAAVVVDPSFRIVSSRGQTASFLELPAGEASLDVLKMVRASLLVALRSALYEARHSRAVARQEGVPLLTDGTLDSVNIEVRPLGSPDAPHFLVSFERLSPSKEPSPPAQGPDMGAPVSSAQSLQLLRELAATREQLHSNIHELAAANEELQSANEEILSSNEELQSTNEELDTAKEELQSTNEELSTLNEELHGRNEDLSHANSDLANLLASVQIPIVMVASDLTIRRFTPAAQRLLNLIPSDIGRPITHIRPNLSAVELDKPIAEVIDTMIAFEREVEDDAGHAYLLRIRPYKSVENRVDGAVLALLDVSATREALSLATRTQDAILSTVREATLLLDEEYNVIRANPAFCRKFGSSEQELSHRSVFALGDGAWGDERLRQFLEGALGPGSGREGPPATLDFSLPGHAPLEVQAQRIESTKNNACITLLVIREKAGLASA